MIKFLKSNQTSFNKQIIEVFNMSEKALLVDKLNLAKQLLNETSEVQKELCKYTSPRISWKIKLIFSTIFSIIVISMFTTEFNDYIAILFVINALVIFTLLQIIDTKLTNDSLEKYKDRIKLLSQQQTDLNEQLLSTDISQKYLNTKILDQFKQYVEHDQADSIRDCILQYENDLRFERLQAEFTELNKALKQHEDTIEKLSKSNEHKNFEIAELKRKIDEYQRKSQSSSDY